MKTSPYLWFRFWGWNFARNLGLLWQQLGAWHVHWKTSDARILFYEQGEKCLLVEAMEWIWSFEGNQEVPKTWFLRHLIQQMVAQRQHKKFEKMMMSVSKISFKNFIFWKHPPFAITL